METGDVVLAVARTQLDYREERDGSNKFGAWFGMDHCAWCVIFAAAWCYNKAGIVGDVVGRTYKEGGLYSCSQTLNWYREHASECITDKPVPGCLVIFDFPNTRYSTDHMGLFVSKTDTTITTIDGNTSNTSEGNGGWVQMRTRKIKDIIKITYIVPKELNADMGIVPRYNTIEEIQAAFPWAVPTINKLIDAGALKGDGSGLDLTEDMIRLLVISDRAGAYHAE